MTAVAFAGTAVGANDFFGIIIAVALARYLMFILIAAEPCLSATTVETHPRNLYLKAGAHSRQDAVQRTRAIGLLTASSPRP
jgi:DNA-binding NarL/FixJ family response regulator